MINIVRALFLLLVLGYFSPAFAQQGTPLISEYRTCSSTSGACTPWRRTTAEACADFLANNSAAGWMAVPNGDSGPGGSCTIQYGSGGERTTRYYGSRQICPAGMSVQNIGGTLCYPDTTGGGGGGTSPPPNNCPVPAGQPTRFGLWTGWGPLGSNTSDGSILKEWPRSSADCNLEGVPTAEACYSRPVDGREKFYCVYNGISAGTTADGTYNANRAPSGPPDGVTNPPRSDIPPTPSPPDGKCPKGSVMAGYNSDGIPMCVGTGTAPPAGAPVAPPKSTISTTKTNADGSTTTTTVTTTTNADGSKTIVTDNVTTAPASSGGGTSTSQTKETGATPSGTPGKETSPEQANFCKQNPQLAVCRESSVTGTCGQIACMGDAIQCATLRAAAMMQCQQKQDAEDLKAMPATALGNSILGGSDPMGKDIAAALKGSEVDLSKPNLDDKGFIGGGSCFPNKTFTAMGRTVTLDMSAACNNIQPLRNVVLACAFIVAYLIVSRSVLSS